MHHVVYCTTSTGSELTPLQGIKKKRLYATGTAACNDFFFFCILYLQFSEDKTECMYGKPVIFNVNFSDIFYFYPDEVLTFRYIVSFRFELVERLLSPCMTKTEKIWEAWVAQDVSPLRI